ncbi:hypothetical protein RB195_003798 [Necator americanus]|uniref:Uncharacterized protein n=1 Tax=Necator americanus TaxID=51031 RepID=A0ABR1DRR2_NECAM
MCVILLCILAIFCPPLAVLFDQGCTAQFWINLLLTFLIWFVKNLVVATRRIHALGLLQPLGHAWVIIFVSVVTTWQDNIVEFVKEFQANPKVSANDKVEDEVAVEVEENLQKDTPDTQ